MISLDDLIEAGRELSAYTHGPVYGRNFPAISYDSRRLRPGDLFVAIRTERADGHDFIEDACSRGAAGVLVERPVDLSEHGATCVVVNDSRAALVAWARFVLARQSPEVIAIAGGVGKTSTQEAIVRVLSDGDAEGVFHNGNLNDLLGLPIALGGLEVTHQVAVLELASDRRGEMSELVEIVRPRTVVITNAAPVHCETLGGLDQFLAEMRALVHSLPRDGLAILNADDPLVKQLASETRASVVLYGLRGIADVSAGEIEANSDGITVTIEFRKESVQIHSPLLGLHSVYTLLAAAAVGIFRGMRLAEIAPLLEGVTPLPGRLRPLPCIQGAIVLDDSLGASPRSVASALETLRLFAPQRIAVLGDIPDLELDRDRGDEAIAAQIAVSADLLVTVGPKAEELGRAATSWGLPAECHIAVSGRDDVVAALAPRLRAGDTVLVKGSEEARMERVVQRLLARPEDAGSVLVRQDPGWKQRVFVPRERPTWIELDMGAIARNVERACALAGPSSDLMIVLKADAYGHGAVAVARTALLHGAKMGAVACLSEAMALREAGIRAPLLLLGYVPGWQARDIVRHQLSATVYSRELALHLSRAAVSAGAPPVPVHIKVDTGMSRLGLLPEDTPAFVAELSGLPGIELEGIFTHLATADEGPEDALARKQLGRFRDLLARLEAEGRSFRYVHAANSAALVNGLGDGFNLVRVGILAYGLDPSPRTRCPQGFQPALSFKTRIAQVKSLPAGTCVSYGCEFVTERPSRIAVIPAGYGDGFRRSPRDWGEVLVRGRRALVVGNVCMDMAMLDVTDIPGVKEGDEVVLIGSQGDERISADDVARRLGTINYEVVTQILPRVPRTIP